MATTKLTDTHLVILGQASQRTEGRVLPLPEFVDNKAGRATRTLKGLLRRELIAEIAAGTDDIEWSRSDDGERLTLAITEAGLAAIGVGREDSGPMAPLKNQRNRGNGSGKHDAESTAKPAFRNGTKGAVIAELLRRKDGATLPDLMDASGWQAHSVRGFVSGTLKKKRGLMVESEKGEDGLRRYRIAA